ncbi:MAG: ATP-binding protein [Myxococcota bacterium]|nr:ATP-binding protein [Myxococcota bacterium]
MREILDGLVGGSRSVGGRERPPFRGLLPCDEGDADRFFGRDAELDAFVERLRHEPTLGVVGASGAGKSSFVAAGVVPRLREQGPWTVLSMRPGRDPLRTLATRLLWRTATVSGGTAPNGQSGAGSFASGLVPPGLDPATAEQTLIRELRDAPERLSLKLGQLAEGEQARVLLVVDQLEELYTTVEQAADRGLFMRALATAADDRQGPCGWCSRRATTSSAGWRKAGTPARSSVACPCCGARMRPTCARSWSDRWPLLATPSRTPP